MLGMLGCGPDNQTEAERLAKTAGDPGAPDPKGVPTEIKTSTGPVSQEDFYKGQMQQTNSAFKKGAYPGGKK
jgi:hypothetical protein